MFQEEHGRVEIGWSGWSDADSGLSTFKYTVYHMEANADDELIEGTVYMPTRTWDGGVLPNITLQTQG